MKNYSNVIFIFITTVASAQTVVNDDFNAGDPGMWTGTPAHFIINASQQLQLNNTGAATSYVTTTFAPDEDELEWSIYVRQAFAGSANNYGRIYLLSSMENLTQPTNGYYLQLGEAGSNDAVGLFRQDGNVSVPVCRAADATIASSFAIRIKVLRDGDGVWKLMIDYSGGTGYIEVATGSDPTYTTGQWMGMVCVYTAGNATRFYYDDVYAGPVRPDVPPPDPAEWNDVVINEFFPDPSPPVGLPEEEFVELYNRSSKTLDLHGWKTGDATSLVAMPSVVIQPGEYVVVTSLPSLNNSADVIKIIDDRGLVIDSINYTSGWYHDDAKSSGGYTIERLDPGVWSNDITNWYVSQDVTGGTPGVKNSVFGRNPDSEAATIVDIRYGADSIVVKFSEPVLQFEVGDFDVELKPDTTAIIRLENLTNGLSYSITIQDVSDLAGNLTASRDFSFTYFIPHRVNPKDIIITEVMADPSPVVQLPEAEYIELYNRSVHPVDLSGWHLEDRTSIGKLPSQIIMPGEYVVLTSTTNASKFVSALGVTSFPSLGNLGDRLVLMAPGDVAIDSVDYDLAWYRNSEKSDGGWSLELIDVDNPCGEEDNWTSSEDLDGGTPGEINSVFANKPDLMAPELVSVTAVAADSLVLIFNERPFTTGSYSLPGIPYILNRSIVVVLAERLQPGILYSIRIADVSDCNGNTMTPATVDVALSERAEPDDVIINEVLFNPRTGESDFVELFNSSKKYIDLKGWRLSGEIIATANDVMMPGSYRVLSDSGMSMPSMPDDEGVVVLVDDHHVIIDEFAYNDSMHSPILADTEGVSLERLSPESEEWHSANASAGYATPGYANSNARDVFTAGLNSVTIQPEVIHPSGAVPFSQIVYRFDNGGMVANVSVLDTEGRVIKTIAANETLGTEGSFQWDGDRNEGGLVRGGYYVVWFQVFDMEGEVRTYRERIVVGF